MLISCMDIRRDSPNACPWFCGCTDTGTGPDPFRCFIHPYLWNANWFEGADLEYVYEYQTHATHPTAAIAPQPGRQSATRRTIMAPSSWNNGCLPSTLITVYAGFWYPDHCKEARPPLSYSVSDASDTPTDRSCMAFGVSSIAASPNHGFAS